MNWLAFAYLITSLHAPPWAAELAAVRPPMTMEVTGYCDVGVTASGQQTHAGLAGCGYAWPFGTRFLLGDGRLVECADRGSLGHDRNVDVWMASCDDALRWGRQTGQAWLIFP